MISVFMEQFFEGKLVELLIVDYRSNCSTCIGLMMPKLPLSTCKGKTELVIANSSS